jgi:3-oxoacyl-[acyl-carrier-protein] synthase II
VSRIAVPPAADPVVISGIGLMTPLGADRETTWKRLLAGDRGIVALTAHDLHPGTTANPAPTPWIGGPVPWPEHCRAELQAGLDPVLVLTRAVAAEALADARISPAELADPRCGCVFGTSKGGLHTVDRLQRNAADASAFGEVWPSNAATQLVRDYGLTGPSLAPVAACATGLVALLQAAALIRQGECDLVLAGSADYSLHPLVLTSFQRLGVLARGEPPHSASRPFDRRRSGFVVGGGAAACVLERASLAVRRGAPIYAMIAAGALGADPTGMTSLDVSGRTLAPLIGRVTENTQRVDLVHLHGTGTRQNDPAECRAVTQALGAAQALPPCTSSKGALGHLLGAAGSVEAALVCLSLRDQLIPPAVNLEEPDPECGLPFVTGRAVPRPLQAVLKLSLGFGGHQAAALFARWPGLARQT